MLADLDQESSLDPSLCGAKAAKLALARRSGLPVLPGFVVTAPTSRPHMRLGAKALAERGSGGARLVVSGAPFASPGELVAAGERVGPELVARSSTRLEATGLWAGAFTSYVDLTPEDLPRAVVGCWASAFTVDALERLEKVGVEPGSFDMAVLVQPTLHPRWGGAAELRRGGTTVIHGVPGSPAPLLQGWVPAKTATGRIGSWEGDLAHELDATTLDSLAELLLDAKSILGANRCEWAMDDDQIWLLQLDTVAEGKHERASDVSGAGEEWRPIVRALIAAPGPLGAELVLPWAMGSGVPDASPHPEAGLEDLILAVQLSRQLAGQVWGMAPDDAWEAARKTLDGLLGVDQEHSLRRINALRDPDPDLSRRLVALVHGLRETVAERGAANSPETAWHLSTSQVQAVLEGEPGGRSRVGSGRWEPLLASVVLTHGHRQRGAAASPGLGAGLVHPIARGSGEPPPPRSVLYSQRAVPVISQLLWDASGVVTHGGSPAAHLFESARSLGVPAVTGVELVGTEGDIVAVDGFAGIVATFDIGK